MRVSFYYLSSCALGTVLMLAEFYYAQPATFECWPGYGQVERDLYDGPGEPEDYALPYDASFAQQSYNEEDYTATLSWGEFDPWDWMLEQSVETPVLTWDPNLVEW